MYSNERAGRNNLNILTYATFVLSYFMIILFSVNVVVNVAVVGAATVVDDVVRVEA